MGTPILGTFVADALFTALGCSMSGLDGMSPCLVAGMDVSWRFTFYYIPTLGLFISPVAFAFGFFGFVILCVVLMILFNTLSSRQRK